jgi:hypothetical protein
MRAIYFYPQIENILLYFKMTVNIIFFSQKFISIMTNSVFYLGNLLIYFSHTNSQITFQNSVQLWESKTNSSNYQSPIFMIMQSGN